MTTTKKHRIYVLIRASDGTVWSGPYDSRAAAESARENYLIVTRIRFAGWV